MGTSLLAVQKSPTIVISPLKTYMFVYYGCIISSGKTNPILLKMNHMVLNCVSTNSSAIKTDIDNLIRVPFGLPCVNGLNALLKALSILTLGFK